jgi:hypothetical protein
MTDISILCANIGIWQKIQETTIAVQDILLSSLPSHNFTEKIHSVAKHWVIGQ